MDIHNIANLESPLYNTLVSKAQRDPWTYSLLANVPSFSKQRVEVAPSSSMGQSHKTAEGTYHFKIPRYGLLSKCVIKSDLDLMVSNEGANQNAVTDGLGWYLYKDVTLQTHNKRIQQLTPEYLQMRSKSLPYEKRQAANSRAGAGIADDGFIDNTKSSTARATYWTDLPFAFSERPQNFLDTRFVENLEVVATANKSGAYGGRLGTQAYNTGQSDLKFEHTTSSPVLVCYFINPTEELYRAYQERNFTLERPLTMLWYDIFVESPEEKALSATSGTITMKLDCNNLVYATHVMVRGSSASDLVGAAHNHDYVNGIQTASSPGGAGAFLPLTNITVKGTSRELVNTSGMELMTVDQEGYGRFADIQDGGGTGVIAGRRIAPGDAIYTIHWGLDGSRTSCSGALSLKNIAAPEISVEVSKAALIAGEKYELIVIHEFFQLVSVQGSDGRVSVGVSV